MNDTRRLFDDAICLIRHFASLRCALFVLSVPDERGLRSYVPSKNDVNRLTILARLSVSLFQNDKLSRSRIVKIVLRGDSDFESMSTVGELLRDHDVIEAENYIMQYQDFRTVKSAVA